MLKLLLSCIAAYAFLQELESPETKEWVAEESSRSDAYFETIDPKLLHILERHTCVPSFSLPVQAGGKQFYCMRNPVDDVYCLYADGKKIYEPEGNQSLSGFSVDPKGEKICYSLSDSGSDLNTWEFLTSEDRIEGLKFCMPIWEKESKGVYYHRFVGETQQRQVLCYTPLGGEEVVLFEDEGHIDLLDVSEDGSALILSKGEILGNKGLHLFHLDNRKLEEIHPKGESPYTYTFVKNGKIYYLFEEALHRIDLKTKKTELVVKEGLIQDAHLAGNQIVCHFLQDATSVLKVYDLDGQKLYTPTLPGRGTVQVGVSQTEDFLYLYTDYATPPALVCASAPALCPSARDYVMEQRFFPSKDGTSIPLFLVYKKGTELTPETPALLYGYGGFNVSITPAYSPLVLSWLDMGGIYASVSLRGGGEYGEAWHQAGMRENKQTVFDDFISAAEALIGWGYTSPAKLAMNGRSNGGLLVGATLTQRPDLFAAAIPQVGVLDMLNFHTKTIGWAWCNEFGNPDDPKDAEILRAYSPLHTVDQNISYPPTLITTADHDDRVVPSHSYQFYAALKESVNGSSHLLRIYPNSGHSCSRSKALWIQENGELLHFLQKEILEGAQSESKSANRKK